MGKRVMMLSSRWTVECSRNIPTLSFFASAFGVSTVNLTRDVDASNTPARVAATSRMAATTSLHVQDKTRTIARHPLPFGSGGARRNTSCLFFVSDL